MEKVTSVTNAIAARTGAGTTPTGMKDMLLRVTAAEVSGEAKARIKVILDSLCVLPLAEGFKLLTATNKLAKDTPEEKTVGVRVSEARQVFGACKAIADFQKKAENCGWHEAVRQARENLKAKGIRANGAKILSPEEREEKAVHQAKAEILAGLSENASDEEKLQVLAQARSMAEAKLMQDDAKAHAERIVKAKGWEYAETLISYLMELEPQAEATEPQQAAK